MKLICAVGRTSAAVQRALWWVLAALLSLAASGRLQRLDALGG